MQTGSRHGYRLGLRGCAAGDLIALHGRAHVLQQKYELGAAVGDGRGEAVWHRHRERPGEVAVEAHLVAEHPRSELALVR